MSKLNKLLIGIIIINLFATIFIAFGKGKKNEQSKVFEIGNFDEFIEAYKAGPSPEKYRNFIQDLVENKFNTLYEETRNLSESQLKSYYEQNNEIEEFSAMSAMQAKYGISDYNTLKKLVEKLKNIKEDGAQYKSCSIVKKSCKYDSDYTTSDIKLSYSKFKEINLNVKMANLIQYDIQTFKISVKEDK